MVRSRCIFPGLSNPEMMLILQVYLPPVSRTVELDTLDPFLILEAYGLS